MAQNDCVFCKILSGQIPAKVLYQDDLTMAFMDINPASRGHCLVIPRQHCVMFSELTEDYACAVAKTVVRVAGMLERAGFAHYNILNNNGEQSGQVVKHVHVHLLPKTSPDDGLVGHFGKCECDVAKEYERLLQFK